MLESYNFKDKSFTVYGLGLTGKSVVNFLKINKVNKIFVWDDNLFKHNFKFSKRMENIAFYRIAIEDRFHVQLSVLKQKC